MGMARTVLLLALTLVPAIPWGVPAATREPAAPPRTPQKPVTDVYHGVKVLDPYRWLEDGKNPAVRKWSNEQNAFARSVLDHLPGRASIRERLQKLYEGA